MAELAKVMHKVMENKKQTILKKHQTWLQARSFACYFTQAAAGPHQATKQL